MHMRDCGLCDRGAVVVDAGRGSLRAPRVLREHLSVERIAVAYLGDDTVSQTVGFLELGLIQIADTIPCGMHAAVARHMAVSHMLDEECCSYNCLQARAWLAENALAALIAATATAHPRRASLLA